MICTEAYILAEPFDNIQSIISKPLNVWLVLVDQKAEEEKWEVLFIFLYIYTDLHMCVMHNRVNRNVIIQILMRWWVGFVGNMNVHITRW